MARYYNILIYPAGTSNPAGTTPLKQYTSFPTVNGVGVNDPNALDITIDAYIATFATASPLTAIIIKGISIADIAQAANLAHCVIQVYAGFQAGLPLNNPNQAKLIIQGFIFQSFANWIGTEMSLDLVVAPQGGTAYPATNISFQWMAGTPLAQALATTLSTAFPNLKQNIQISPKLIITHTETGQYQSMPAFGPYLKNFTQSALGGTYPGVEIAMTPTQINVYDQSTQGTPIQLLFQDLIGQPIWIKQYTIQFTCPMRGDLQVGDYIKMPQGLLGNPNNPAGAPGAVTTTAGAYPAQRQASIFNGSFIIQDVHHIGSFRQPNGMAWVTVINANLTISAMPTSTAVHETLQIGP